MDIDEAELVLSASPNHRILKRAPPASQWRLAEAGGDVRRALFVDIESTGLSHDTDEVIELALLSFEYDARSGAIVRVDEAGAYSGLQQPSFPIPPESTAIHGIKDADVAGRTIDAAIVNAMVGKADLVIAHNAGFDRPMAEKFWTCFSERPWACSFLDVDWKGEGMGAGKLDYLLMRQGYFHDGHRALNDALAGVFLLTLPLPQSGKPTLGGLLESARRSLKAVRAEDAPIEHKDTLKQRGYRWDPGDGRARPKSWWIFVQDAEAEIAWLNENIYRKPRKVPVIDVPASRRYSGRIWSV